MRGVGKQVINATNTVFNETFTGHYFSLTQTLYGALLFISVLLEMLLTQRHLVALLEGAVLCGPNNAHIGDYSLPGFLLVAIKRSPLLRSQRVEAYFARDLFLPDVVYPLVPPPLSSFSADFWGTSGL